MDLKITLKRRRDSLVIEPQVKSSCWEEGAWEYSEVDFRHVGIISLTLMILTPCTCVFSCVITSPCLCSFEINLKLIRHFSYSKLGKLLSKIYRNKVSKTSQDKSVGWKWTLLLCFFGEIKNRIFFPCGGGVGENGCSPCLIVSVTILGGSKSVSCILKGYWIELSGSSNCFES